MNAKFFRSKQAAGILASLFFLFIPLILCDNSIGPSSGEKKREQDTTQTDDTTGTDTTTGIIVPDTIDFSDSLDTVSIVVTSNPAYSFSWSTYVWNTWITVSDSGRNGDTLAIIVDRGDTNMHTGIANGWFYINTSHDSLDSKKVNIVARKLAAGDPKLSVSCGHRDFEVKFDSLSCHVTNDSGGKLIWRATGPSWLQIVPDSGVFEQNNIQLYALRDSLEPGAHIDSILFTSNGGDTAIPVSISIPTDTAAYSITEFWPQTVGNRWVWVHPDRTSWLAIEVVDSFSREGSPVWKWQADDSDGGYMEFYVTIVSTIGGDIFTITADSSKLTNVTYGLYPDCGSIDCWKSTYVFGLFALPITPGGFNDPYWKTSGEYISGSLAELMSTFPIWANDSAGITDPAITDVDTCMGLRQRGTATHKLYTILAKGVGPLIWDGFVCEYCRLDGREYGELPQIQRQHFSVNDDTTSELLYWFQGDCGTKIYYLGYRDNGMPVPNHIIFEDDNGDVLGTVFMRADFLPAMWVFDDMTIGLHNVNPYDSLAMDSAFDPRHAYHMTIVDGEQHDFYADVYPHDPYEVLDSLEWHFNTWLTHLRDDFESFGIQSYEDLVALAYIDWPRRERWQVIASFIAMGAAIVEYEMDTVQELSKGKTSMEVIKPSVPPNVGEMEKKIGEFLKDELNCKYCPKPGVPTIRMLQCQGLKAVLWTGQVCHNSYMHMTTATECLGVCQVSTMCFTNICMPRDVAVSDVEDVLFDNNLELTPDEVYDLVKQNAGNLKPIVELFLQ